VQGSTQLRARHGDRVADEMLGDHEAIVRRAIGGHVGTEVAFFGDGFLATLEDALALDDWIAFDGRLVRSRAAIAATAALTAEVAARYRELGLPRHAALAE
jgi:class 3 adenylate cyclase